MQTIYEVIKSTKVKNDYCKKNENTRPLLYGDIYLNNKRLVRGNYKLKNMLVFDIPAVKTCLNCGTCKKTCYALKAQNQYPNVKIFRYTNMFLFTDDKELLFNLIVKQLSTTKMKMVRLHSSGDFFTQSYIDFWDKIIGMFPKIKFYTYTKVENILDFSGIEKNKNFNLISSFIDGKLNYGSLEYIKKMEVDYGCYICPATINSDVKCGKDCNYCVSNKNVVFLEH